MSIRIVQRMRLAYRQLQGRATDAERRKSYNRGKARRRIKSRPIKSHLRSNHSTCWCPSVAEAPASLNRTAFCQSVVNEYFGKAVEASFMEDYLTNDTKDAVSSAVLQACLY